MITDAQKRASQKYNSKSYDQLKVIVRKGQRDIIKSYAEKNGESLNGYINRIISDDMEKHGEPLSTAPPSQDNRVN